MNIDDFETHDTRLLRPGAAFSIEPGVYLPTFGVRSEINVVLEENGPKVYTPTQRELLTLIFEEAGQTPRMGETPSLIFRGLAPFVPVVRELAELLYQWEKPYVFSHAKFERAFGADVTPHREAVRRTVDWFRRHPKQ